MISQKDVKRRYDSLMEDVKTNDFYKVNLTNRVNCYICIECSHITKTKDVDPGVTPFIFKCEKCGKIARSTMYEDTAPGQKATFEWFRPTLKEILKMRRKHEKLLNHVLQGGLNYRKC